MVLGKALRQSPTCPDTLLFGANRSVIRRLATPIAHCSVAGRLSQLCWLPSEWRGASTHISKTDWKRPFRGSTKRGGEDSCGGI